MKFIIETGKDNPKLREISQIIKPNELKEYIKLGEEMVKFLKNPDNNGVGLAAPQIGINRRLISVSLLKDYEDKNYKTIMMINPEIIDCSSEQEIDNEGCLSIPKKFGDVIRNVGIKVKFIDSKGKENILILSGIPARIVQHEIDHLDGILFTDKIIKSEPIGKNL